MALQLTNENFDKEVLQADEKVIVDFWAEWCAPCKMLAPVIDELSQELTDVKVCKVNIDDAPEIANKYGVMSIPTIMLFENGEEKDTRVGLLPKQAILDMLA